MRAPDGFVIAIKWDVFQSGRFSIFQMRKDVASLAPWACITPTDTNSISSLHVCHAEQKQRAIQSPNSLSIFPLLEKAASSHLEHARLTVCDNEKPSPLFNYQDIDDRTSSIAELEWLAWLEHKNNIVFCTLERHLGQEQSLLFKTEDRKKRAQIRV